MPNNRGNCEVCGRATNPIEHKGLFLCSFCLEKERMMRSELKLDVAWDRRYCHICGKQLKGKYKQSDFCADCSKLSDSEKEYALKIREMLKKGFHERNRMQ